MLIKKIHTKTCFFSRMRRSVTAESIPTKFCTSTPWGNVVIYLAWHRNWLRGLDGWGCENWPLPLTLALASNTAYCATAHMRDKRSQFVWTFCWLSAAGKLMQNHRHTYLRVFAVFFLFSFVFVVQYPSSNFLSMKLFDNCLTSL